MAVRGSYDAGVYRRAHSSAAHSSDTHCIFTKAASNVLVMPIASGQADFVCVCVSHALSLSLSLCVCVSVFFLRDSSGDYAYILDVDPVLAFL